MKMNIKIAVVNNSGNMGKSTICDSLLLPRLEGAKVVKVETINTDGTNDVKISAKEFLEITKKIGAKGSVIVDVGSSNVEIFFEKIMEFHGTQEDFDYFIVPVTPENKGQMDTLLTIGALLDLNVEPERIRVIFNKVDPGRAFDKQFSGILENQLFCSLKIKRYPIIRNTELFFHLNEMNKTLKEVLDDDRDFRKLMRECEDDDELEILSTERAIKRLATGVNEDLNMAFNLLDIV
ncbi:transcriptional regulator [Salmonella enterica]|nr:transcriptional regulator [Salmonella enterica]